jgi:hypothetical protein
MKKTILLILSVVLNGMLAAQNVGIGTNAPHASAALEIKSSSKGFLAPRLSTVQRNAIVSPAEGLLVYDTDSKSFFQFNGSAWQSIAGGGAFNLPYAQTLTLDASALKIDNWHWWVFAKRRCCIWLQ